MKKDNYKKIILGTLVTSMVLTASLLSFPNKAHATAPVVDVGNITQSTITAANTTASAFSQYSLQLKAFVLDTLATTLVKTLIRQITGSVVNWINSGFQGSPSFITNPGSFFLDVADQVSGEFLAGAVICDETTDAESGNTIKTNCRGGGPLTALCSPFSIDIRLKLAFKYHPKIQQKYACTLGAIIKNSSNAVSSATINGRSINGFMDGDFSQGGLPAFVSLTTEPQNNPYGAYLEADSELGIRVANAHVSQKDELNQGKGFLSWKKCTTLKTESTSERANQGSGEGDYTGPERSSEGSGESFAPETKCETQTPGSLIVSNLETSVNGPLHELELVDSINEIVGALAAQLVNTILQGGLRAISGTGPSDSTAYINQIQAEANAGNPAQFNTLRNNFISSVERYITDTLRYKNNKDQSLNLILDVKNTYDSAKACYANKMANSSQNSAFMQSKIDEINSIENTSVTPLATALLEQAKMADARYSLLVGLRDQGNAARTANDLNGPSQTLSQMLQNQSLTTAKDISDSQAELDATRASTVTMKQDAQRKLQECQILPNGPSF